MKAYWITRCHVHNSHEYDEYIKLAGPAISSHGGTFLVRGGEQIEFLVHKQACQVLEEQSFIVCTVKEADRLPTHISLFFYKFFQTDFHLQ